MNFHIFLYAFAAVCALTVAFEYSEDYSEYEDSGEHETVHHPTVDAYMRQYHHHGDYPHHHGDYPHHHGDYPHYEHHDHPPHQEHWDHHEIHPQQEDKADVTENYNAAENTSPVVEVSQQQVEEVAAVTEQALAQEENSGIASEAFQAEEEDRVSVKEEFVAKEEEKVDVRQDNHDHDHDGAKCCPCYDAEESHNKPVEEAPAKYYDLKKAPQLFEKFVKDYNKQYIDQADYTKHYENFVKNLEEINIMNAFGGSATFDINEFADLDDDEIDAKIGSPSPLQ